MGELIRRILAGALERIDDDRLAMVSLTGVEVDRDLQRAIVWFTNLDTDDTDTLEAFEEHAPRLRSAIGRQARLRRTPKLLFRPDEVLRSAERIERLIARAKTRTAEASGE